MKSFKTLMEQGIHALEQGNANKARSKFKSVLKMDKDQPDALHLLGIAEHKCGQNLRAIQCIRKAVRVSYANVQYLNNLGQIEVAAGRVEDAVDTYLKALDVAPDQVEVLNNLANALAKSNRAIEAINYLERARQISPRYLPAAYNLARIYLQEKEFAKTVSLCEAILATDERYPDVRTTLGLAYHRVNRSEQGIKILREAIATNPADRESVKNLILVLDETGRSVEAIETVERAVAAFPGSPEFIERQAIFYRRKGDFIAASAAARELSQYPGWRGCAYLMLVSMLALNSDGSDIRNIRSHLKAPDLEDDERADLNFALYGVENDAGNWDDAFVYLSHANNLMHKARPFKIDDLRRLHIHIREAFAEEVIHQPRIYDDEYPCCIFIVGMPRSGSTLIERIIASHPRAASVGESQALIDVEREFDIEALHSDASDEINAKLQGARRAYFSQHPAMPNDCNVLIDKQLNNYRNVGLINLLFPESRIIHAVRDPMAIGFSCFEQRFSQGQEFSFDLASIGEYYTELMNMMDRWKKMSKVPILNVQYEEIIDNQRAMTDKILEFCGLPWDERCLRFFKSDGAVKTASVVQVRQPLYTDKVAHWQNYEHNLAPLKNAIQLGAENIS
jgi:tetratricopeptide (TPR) repeat protein